MADGTTKPIGKIKTGDKVEAADPATAKNMGGREVQHVWLNHDNDLLDVAVRTGRGPPSVIHTTANHPFWDDTAKAWRSAADLKVGDRLASIGDQAPVVAAVSAAPDTDDRYNLTVDDLHTYYVVADDTPVLVHNICERIVNSAIDSMSGLRPTAAIAADAEGTALAPIVQSGRDALSARVNGALQKITGRNATWSAADHAEPKVALWMNDNNVDFANVIINQDYVCGEAGGAGCSNIIPALLQQGRTMVVWFRDKNGVLKSTGELNGTAPRP